MKTHRVTLPTPIHAAALRGEVWTLLVRMKPQPQINCPDPIVSQWRWRGDWYYLDQIKKLLGRECPYAPGDLIACREPWSEVLDDSRCDSTRIVYRDEVDPEEFEWYPASRMPLAACRLWFRVQSVEACRVADVTEEEARAMGYRRYDPDGTGMMSALEQFRHDFSAGWNDWAWKLKVERTER